MVVRDEVLVDLLPDYDTAAVELGCGLTLIWMDHNYTEHWAHRLGIEGNLELPPAIDDRGLLPTDAVIAELARIATASAAPRYAVIWTEYFGGVGDQCAAAYAGDRVLDSDGTINGALRALGVYSRPGLDEFDTVGLGRLRSIPDELYERWLEYPDRA